MACHVPAYLVLIQMCSVVVVENFSTVEVKWVRWSSSYHYNPKNWAEHKLGAVQGDPIVCAQGAEYHFYWLLWSQSILCITLSLLISIQMLYLSTTKFSSSELTQVRELLPQYIPRDVHELHRFSQWMESLEAWRRECDLSARVHVWENFELFFWALSYIDLVLASCTHQGSQSNKTQQECDRQTRIANRKWVGPRIALLYTWGFTQEGLPTRNGDQCVVNNLSLFKGLLVTISGRSPPTWFEGAHLMVTNLEWSPSVKNKKRQCALITCWSPFWVGHLPYSMSRLFSYHNFKVSSSAISYNFATGKHSYCASVFPTEAHDMMTQRRVDVSRYTIYTWSLIDLDSMFMASHNICVLSPYIQSCPDQSNKTLCLGFTPKSWSLVNKVPPRPFEILHIESHEFFLTVCWVWKHIATSEDGT